MNWLDVMDFDHPKTEISMLWPSGFEKLLLDDRDSNSNTFDNFGSDNNGTIEDISKS